MRLQKAKLQQEMRQREMALLFKQAPKSRGEIEREKAAKKAGQVVRQAQSAKIDLYNDPREAEKNARREESSEDWDQAKLESVVKMKMAGQSAWKATDIVCKHFLDAVEKGVYGWFWKCPQDKACKYKHNLPPGFVLKKKKVDGEEEEDTGPTLEEIIETKRAELGANGTPVTLESFMVRSVLLLAAAC